MTHPLIRNFQALATYNERANLRLYEACATLDEAQLKEDRKAFFTSILGTLNHILVADRVWMSRFTGQAMTSYSLAEILYGDFADLSAARQREDQRISTFVQDLTEALINGNLTWTTNAGITRSEDFSLLLTHLFNHQTHHRGQVHNMLSQAGVKTPVLDLSALLGRA